MSSENLDWNFTPYVFVYGSLKTEGWNNKLLSLSDFILEAKTSPDFVLVDSGFPYAIHKNSVFYHEGTFEFASIAGEIWRLPDANTLRLLDRLEGHPHHYTRTPIWVKFGGDEYPCWIYLVHDDNVLTLPLCERNEEGSYEWHAN